LFSIAGGFFTIKPTSLIVNRYVPGRKELCLTIHFSMVYTGEAECAIWYGSWLLLVGKRLVLVRESGVSCGFDHKTSHYYVFDNKKVAEHTVLVVQLMKKYGKL
jgi:hypothetical protein